MNKNTKGPCIISQGRATFPARDLIPAVSQNRINLLEEFVSIKCTDDQCPQSEGMKRYRLHHRKVHMSFWSRLSVISQSGCP